jgi:large subunit ribosomal protein L15
MELNSLKYSPGSRKSKKRVGRGIGSGVGKTSGRGENGAGSRSGNKKRAWFEGGQMPLQRRIPKFGFHNHFRVEYSVVNIDRFDDLKIKGELTPEVLVDNGLIKDLKKPVKILGNGELKGKFDVKAHKFSKSAEEKITQAGGSVTLL